MIRLRDGAVTLSVDVRDEQCPARVCFWPARHTVRSPAGSSGVSSRTIDRWECGRRDQTGCPRATPLADQPRYRKERGVWRERP